MRLVRDDPPVHRYVNCDPPFDPKVSALAGLPRSTEALRCMFDGFLVEYEAALARGDGPVWERAVVATAALFRESVCRPCG